MNGDSCANEALLGYYKWHARIYDATRWCFLFGRDRIVRLAAAALGPRRAAPLRILEVGCGTGRNLSRLLTAFPAARVTGIDLCPSMLDRARRATAGHAARVRLLCAPYAPESFDPASADLILFSYSLTMFNPGFDAALDAARNHLAPNGILAVADFRRTRFPWFERWMGVNHVRMDDHLLPALGSRFAVLRRDTRAAYGGGWDYFCYLGQARSHER
ncbi:Methyltransferase type 11 [Solidesulfovibrio fructosivorans JJ]]|uniref:Methyltransferase type 11 n=1 Tax=Solidesulfovibrio fructosivorans JJ] TaxID=596151 RepID=E1JXA7_SOLFR|nr:class I SAM-dependent methyltransferase [Solidesulfovibrio fructosivorans]EFL51072.1 Methyltransferase type 11 [Solidesulfovibrio fructosivorans JJ]]